MPEIKEIELRSEEVQEILTRIPHWMIRWGNLVILLLLFLVLLMPRRFQPFELSGQFFKS